MMDRAVDVEFLGVVGAVVRALATDCSVLTIH